MLGRVSLNPFRADRRVVGKSCVSIEVTTESRGVTRERPRHNAEGVVLDADQMLDLRDTSPVMPQPLQDSLA